MLSALLAGLAAMVLLARPGHAARRVRSVTGPRPSVGSTHQAGTSAGPQGVRGRAFACASAGLACALVVGPPAGLVLGLLVGLLGPRLLGHLEPRDVRRARERCAADLPLALDLLAATLAGGAPPDTAVATVGAAVAGPCGERFSAVAAALRVGTPPAEAWPLVVPEGAADGPLAAAARALARAAEGGAPVAGTVSQLAADLRAQAVNVAAQRARRVGVLVVAPLGVCFLPAFVLLGVVPVVVGLAAPLLASW